MGDLINKIFKSILTLLDKRFILRKDLLMASLSSSAKQENAQNLNEPLEQNIPHFKQMSTIFLVLLMLLIILIFSVQDTLRDNPPYKQSVLLDKAPIIDKATVFY